MLPYDTPLVSYEEGPATALAPQFLEHGTGSFMRIIKGNPIGMLLHPDDTMSPYLSARGEHMHYPVEQTMLLDESMHVDHYRVGQQIPARAAQSPVQKFIKLSRNILSQFGWPDASVGSMIDEGKGIPAGDPHATHQFWVRNTHYAGLPQDYKPRSGQK